MQAAQPSFSPVSLLSTTAVGPGRGEGAGDDVGVWAGTRWGVCCLVTGVWVAGGGDWLGVTQPPTEGWGADPRAITPVELAFWGEPAG